MAIIGGGIIKEFNSSMAWGVNPSVASGVAVLDGAGELGIAVGDYIVYSFDGLASFTGIVSECSERVGFGSGKEFDFQVVDNRVRLAWQEVFGAFNIEDEVMERIHGRPDAPSTGEDFNEDGGDGAGIGDEVTDTPDAYEVVPNAPPPSPWTVRRRWRHMLPEHWASGTWTYTNAPLTVREVLNSAFNKAWGRWGFSRSYDPAQDAVVTGLDFTTGIKLSNLIGQLNSKTGLEVRISGARNLVWGRKGDGLALVPDATCKQWNSGESITSADTRIRVVGEPIRIQKLNIELEPDWVTGWEAYIDELAWLRAVAETFVMPMATKADWANIAAFARQVTVLQFSEKIEDKYLLDGRKMGLVCRNDIPAWVYIRELVFRSYRIPEDFKLCGIPLDSLELAETLLCSVTMDNAGANTMQVYPETEPQYYPQVQAALIVKGQPLDLINARDIATFYRNAGKNLSVEWSEAPQFEVDPIGKSVRFSTPVFIDGIGDNSIYLLKNRGEGGGTDLSEGNGASDFLDVVVPNPDFVITPAAIKAAFTFLVGRFYKDYGTGPRHGAYHSGGLDIHLLDATDVPEFANDGLGAVDVSMLKLPSVAEGAVYKEVLYEDGEGAFQKADAIAGPLTALSPTQVSGGFTRVGVAGSVLTPVTDRITVNISRDGGVVEQVEYTKARTSSAGISERTLQRVQRTEELYPGQEALAREARQYQLLSVLERDPAEKRAQSHTTFQDVFTKPVGSDGALSTKVVSREVRSWEAGDLVWLDKDGMVATHGGMFAGVVVAAVTGREVYLCHSGRVPVKVSGNIPPNGVIMGSPGSGIGSCLGQCAIGRLVHGQAVPTDAVGMLVWCDVSAPGPDCRFRMTFDYERQRLYVGPGAAGVIVEGALVHPQSAILGGSPLDETPYWDISDKEIGQWMVVCKVSKYQGDPPAMFLVQDEIELNLDEESIAWHVGSVSLAMSDGKRTLAAFDQIWWSDITVEFDVGGSGSGGLGSSSSYPSASSGGGGSGSSKDTAIVPASWTRDKHTALFAIESPDVRFVDWVQGIYLTARVTRVEIDARMLEVCAPGTVQAFAVVASSPLPVGVEVCGNELVIRCLPFMRPRLANVTLVGTRAGFCGMRFPNRTAQDFQINERRLNLFKPMP